MIWTPFEKAILDPEGQDQLKKLKAEDKEVWLNNFYQVNVKELPEGWQWLSIKRKDKQPIHDWRHLQRIKNEICGPEFEAVELYPAESRLVDTANQFHLFVLPRGEKFPFGYKDRLIVEKSFDGSKQRPFEKDNRPKDITSEHKFKRMLREATK